ncbi:UDP-N-acetylmuramoyl-tripeptide--D-alanyl-D-alanine ligase [Desulforhopalus sp. 52FAK]
MNAGESDLAKAHVSHITSDSREVTSKTLFIALEGVGVDGHNFVTSAISSGATAVVGGTGRLKSLAEQHPEVVFVEADNTYEAYAIIAANYFNNPARELTLAAVTGTNGKTTVTYIVEDIFKEAGKSVGVIGTVNNRYTTSAGETTFLPTRFTTPEAYSLQGVLREMADNGVDYVIMEVSSHALAQSRVGSLTFQAAAFTNLSRDHLDYHQGMNDYFSAKKSLFVRHLMPGATAILPQVKGSDDVGGHVAELYDCCKQAGVSVLSWGAREGADIRLIQHISDLNKTNLEVDCVGKLVATSSLLVGDYNVDNLLTSMGLCVALGLEEKDILAGVSSTTGAPGRLQRITVEGWGDCGPTVFVDYAHTPDALEKVLSTAKELPHRELYGVFGCGGDRDSGKRAVMGRIGATLCDVSLVTDDNPRTEDPGKIVAQVVEGVTEAGHVTHDAEWLTFRNKGDKGCVVIRDRHEAIFAAIKNSQKGDIVVIAGKGHEPYQLTIHGKKFFDDRMQAQDALCSWSVPMVAMATGGECTDARPMENFLGEVVTDSRLSTDDGIFVALEGENHDAHAFAGQAVENGARCLVVSRRLDSIDSVACQIVVKDTLRALGDLAAFRRKRLGQEFKQTVIGLTGSCGKTTVKEMIAAIVKRKFPEGEHFPENAVLKTEGNYNNLIGLPLSLLPIGVHQKVAVLEMGMNVPGEIERLAEIADPDISCITNIHGAHLLGLHSIEGVADAKEELYKTTKPSGTLIVNLDDSRVAARAEKYAQKKITFGHTCLNRGVTPDVFATDIKMLDGGVITFSLHHNEASQEIHLYIAGEHNVVNALCAAATTIAAGCSLDEIALGLADFRAPDKRMELFSSKCGFQILNDTYNANPASMEAGLRALADIGPAKKLAVIGDMLELGDDSSRAHYEIGRIAAALRLDFVICLGEWSSDIIKGMLDGGADTNNIMMAETKEDVEKYLKDQVTQGNLGSHDLVLFKASRGLRFETMVECFR